MLLSLAFRGLRRVIHLRFTSYDESPGLVGIIANGMLMTILGDLFPSLAAGPFGSAERHVVLESYMSFSSFAPYGITGLPSSPGGGKLYEVVDACHNVCMIKLYCIVRTRWPCMVPILCNICTT